MKQFYRYFFLLSFLFSVSANAQFTDGIFVLNEGGAGSGNASVSFIDASGSLQNNIFSSVNNGMPLGDTAQGMFVAEDKTYIALNISNTLQVVDSNTFQHIHTVSQGLTNPRYVHVYNGSIYVTCWGSSNNAYVAVIDSNTFNITTTIPLAEGVEKIIEANGKLYVAHKGGYGYNNLISVINPVNNTLEHTITVGDVPNSMLVKNGVLYVLCEGRPSWGAPETPGSLWKINITDNSIIGVVNYSSNQQHPAHLSILNDELYFAVGGLIYTMGLNDTAFPTVPVITTTISGFYGMYGFNIINGKLYAGDAGGFVAPGKTYIYSPEGNLLETLTVGICPNGYYKSLDSAMSNGKNNLELKVTVYPNPATDVVYIDTDKNISVKLHDMAGKLIKSEKYITSGISLSGINKGVYLMEISSDNLKTVKKIVVK